MTAPFGRRLCEVSESRASGGYRLFSLIDTAGPEPQPGQFYMLATEQHWEQGEGRPFLPRALSVAETGPAAGGVRLDFLIEGIGPGTDRLCELEPGESVWLNGPLGNSFSVPRKLAQDAAGAILVGGGIGIAPLALLRRTFAAKNIPTRTLLGFRDETHSGGLDALFACCEVRLASDDGHAGHHGYVTDLLASMLEGDDAARAAVYACGPPPMLDAVATLCTAAGVPCELAMESPMACGYGACFGCAVPKPGGGYLRLCVDGPVLRGGAAGPVATGDPPLPAVAKASSGAVPPATPPPRSREAAGSGDGADQPATTELCGIELSHPVVNASGTFDAIAARRVYGDELLSDFPFSAFVSKTITPEPRAGNDPQRIWETPAGMINSIGLPNKGLDGFLAEDLPQLADLPVPLIVSVMATGHEEFARLVNGVGERDEVAAIELNVSCPNVHSGLIVGEQPAETTALLEALRPLTEKPLIAKLTPNVANPADIAIAAEEGGADAVSLINTLKASAIDPATGEPGIAAGHGGLSGPAVRPIAVAQLRAVAAAVSIPIVGMGGISCGADAIEMLSSGATLVAVGTENFRDPRAGGRVAAEIAGALKFGRSNAPIGNTA
ncbi:MAG: dihydroorotate dehydrogenase catalytic subunit [Solirubrobacterales bacterium]|jgi:dihydroorotate dehydrogenase subfamily 1|nr:dihydroorotate dehydrogenase catalytic subunit [Solirubrobacterales bacterium]